MGSTKGFSVDPDALMKVAQQVDDLHSLIAEGNAQGNLPDLTNNAGADQLKTALGVFWSGGGEDPLAQAYQTEHDAIVKTYQSMASQLQDLVTTCRNTAQTYQDHDDQSSSQVTASGDTGWTATG